MLHEGYDQSSENKEEYGDIDDNNDTDDDSDGNANDEYSNNDSKKMMIMTMMKGKNFEIKAAKAEATVGLDEILKGGDRKLEVVHRQCRIQSLKLFRQSCADRSIVL